jgi:hypothetical protein
LGVTTGQDRSLVEFGAEVPGVRIADDAAWVVACAQPALTPEDWAALLAASGERRLGGRRTG